MFATVWTWSTGAPITFTYDITADDPTAFESVILNYDTSFAAGPLPAVGPIIVTAAVSLAPTAPGTAIPLFVVGNVEGKVTAISISDCITNLLLPWVTNFNIPSSKSADSHYDTGIAIANTTKDPFGASGGALAQMGSCSLTMFPSDGTGPFPYVSPVVGAGTTLLFAASSAWPGKSGYVIGTCTFQNAHAYVSIGNNTGLGAHVTTQDYLGLVLPNPSVWSRNPASIVGCGTTFKNDEGEVFTAPPCGTGESLGN